MADNQTDNLKNQIVAAAKAQRPVVIQGGNSKAFLGQKVELDHVIHTRGHTGIVSYEPGELTLTARSGTPLKDIEAVLAEHHQMLAFEPPHFGSNATLGGTIACNLSGPRRAYAGAARDFVLGTRIINGKGEILRFGGEVIKNVAGYDVSRLMTGAMGTLGLLLDVSLKVLPLPEHETTRSFEVTPEQAITKMNAWAGQSLPVSATCYFDQRLHVRLSGTKSATLKASEKLGGETFSKAGKFWRDVREQMLPFFENSEPLWRLSLPSLTQPLEVIGRPMLMEWGGAQRWFFSSQAPMVIRELLEDVGGHASKFKNHEGVGDIFHPLSPGVKELHRNLKTAFDPLNILNPGRQYPDL